MQVKGIQSNEKYETGQARTVEPRLDIEPISNPESIFDPLEELADTGDNSDVALVKTEKEDVVIIKNIELDLQIEQIIEKHEGLWQCKVCGKTIQSRNSKQNMRDHAEIHIKGISHSCNMCDKTFSTRHSLRSHKSYHSELLFTCNVCGKSGMNKMSYANHKKRAHKVSLMKS